MTLTLHDDTFRLFGFFELDKNGTVLYQRSSENRAPTAGPERPAIGQNFFEEIGVMGHGDLLKRRFKNFLDSGRSVDSFDFEGLYEELPVKAKVLMTKGHETHDNAPAGIVIMNIIRNI
jgi:hypothetical protein